MKRGTLNGLVKFMFSLVVLAFFYVLLRSLSPFIGSDTSVVDNLQPGETAMRRLDGRRAWITHLSDQQKQALRAIPNSAIMTEGGCLVTAKYCIVDAAAKRAGIELVYSKERPSVMLKSKPWEGGFIDPTSGAIYDLLGRAYTGQVAVRLLETRSR